MSEAEKKSWSLSRLKQYKYCPRLYFLRYLSDDKGKADISVNYTPAKYRYRDYLIDFLTQYLQKTDRKEIPYSKLESEFIKLFNKKTAEAKQKNRRLTDAAIAEQRAAAVKALNFITKQEVIRELINTEDSFILDSPKIDNFQCGEVDVLISYDFAFIDKRGNTNVVFIEWNNFTPDRYPLLMLYAMKSRGITSDKVNIYAINTEYGKIQADTISEEDIIEFQDMILRSSEYLMNNSPNEEDYPLTKDEGKCPNCKLYSKCPRGKDIIANSLAENLNFNFVSKKK